MICPKCGGSGKNFCSMCKGTGLYHEDDLMTEEEYIQSCDTEQLAEFIVNLTLLDKYKLYDRMESAEYEQGIGIGAKKVIVEWLKEEHK